MRFLAQCDTYYEREIAMLCPYCGNQVADGTSTCPYCTAQIGPRPTNQSAGATPKPDFKWQTDYRVSTFEQGGGQAPDPSQPLSAANAATNQAAPQQQTPPYANYQHAAGHHAPAQPANQGQAAQQNAADTSQQPAPKKGKGGKTAALVILAIILVAILGALGFKACTGGLASWVEEQNGQSQTVGSHQNSGLQPASGAVTGGEAEGMSAPGDETWTVLFYVCGSDLESEKGLATFNLNELVATDLGDKVTFAIETGGARQWQNATVDERYLTRYQLDGRGFNQVSQLPSASMAAESTFADFLNWGTKTYPADHYMLVVWDHGGGSLSGVCLDEIYPYDSRGHLDTLTLQEMESALSSNGTKFDVIGFDTCLMACYETANILSPYADYLVASEEVEPGTGWDYSTWPEWLASNTAASGAQVGVVICDSFYNKCVAYRAADMATLSVIDLSKMNALSDAFDAASREFALATDDPNALRALYNGSIETACFGGDSQQNLVDMGGLMKNVSSVTGSQSDKVITCIDDAVVYQVHGRSHPDVSGLSLFYPLNSSDSREFDDFLDVACNVPYAQFVAVMYNQYDTINWTAYSNAVPLGTQPLESDDMQFSFTESINDSGEIEITVTDGVENIAAVSMELALLLEDEKIIVYMGTDRNINGSVSSGVFSDNFYGDWMGIDGNAVSAILLEAGDGYNMYAIPILLNGEPSNLIAYYSYSENAYEIICACPVIGEEGLASKDLRALEEGDKIEFQFTAVSLETDETFTFEMGEVTWSDSVTMEDVDLGDGAWLYRFVMTDVLGDDHYSDMYVQNAQGDQITVETLEEYFDEIGFEL